MPTKTFRNWNGSSTCQPSHVYYPSTTREIVRTAVTGEKCKRIRVVGKGVHTYGDISMCDTGDVMMVLSNYNKLVSLDMSVKTVTVQAGMALEDLLPYIEEKHVRLALKNMGEITEQCIGGVTATATHGSGGGLSKRADSFSDQVVSYKVMECTPEAKIYTISRRKTPNEFPAFMTHLGTLAIILEVTLQLTDWYHLEWNVRDIGHFLELDTSDIQKRYSEVYSLSYTFFPATDEIVEVSRDLTTKKFESGIGSDILDDFVSTLRQGASRCLRLFPFLIKPYAKFQKRALLTLKGKSDMWRKVLSQGDLWGGSNVTLMTDLEYAVPIDKTLRALFQIRTILRRHSQKTLSVVGIRFVRGSPALLCGHHSSATDQQQVFAYINVQVRTKTPKRALVKELESTMIELGGRPHWGKLNTITTENLTKVWPKENLDAFLRVKQRYDPHNCLGNNYLDKALFGKSLSSDSNSSQPSPVSLEKHNQTTSSSSDDEDPEITSTGSF